MNATETKIANTFAPAILDEIEAEVMGWTEGSNKGQGRALKAIAARRVRLEQGVEETHEGGSPQLLAQKRKVRWIPIKRIEGTKVYLDGWRHAGSRKSNQRKMLKKPRLLFDAAEIETKIKLGKPAGARKKKAETPAKKVIVRKTRAVGKSTMLEKQCCERDHDHDGNCDRHPAVKP